MTIESYLSSLLDDIAEHGRSIEAHSAMRSEIKTVADETQWEAVGRGLRQTLETLTAEFAHQTAVLTVNKRRSEYGMPPFTGVGEDIEAIAPSDDGITIENEFTMD